MAVSTPYVCISDPAAAPSLSGLSSGKLLTVGRASRHTFALLAIDVANVLLLADTGDAACAVGDGAVGVDTLALEEEDLTAHSCHVGPLDGYSGS